MKKFKVSWDYVCHDKKPNSCEAAAISNRISETTRDLNENNMESFVKNVGNKGCTLCPATFKRNFKTTRSKEFFEQMQLLVLDFDGGISFEKAHNKAKNYNLPVLFAYETFSSTEENERFRLVFLNDTSITDKRVAKIAKNALLTIFPEADKHDCDIAKMYYGGKKLKYFNQDNPSIDINSLLMNMTYYLKENRGNTHYKKHVKKFAEDNKIKLNKKGLLDISQTNYPTELSGTSDEGKNSPSAIIFSTANGEDLPCSSNSPKTALTYYRIALDSDNSNGSSVVERNLRLHNIYRSNIIKNITDSCQLFNEFVNGKRRLHHDELFGISTNIIRVESGALLFETAISKYENFYDKTKCNRWKFYLKYNKDQDYKPRACNTFCPYKDKCNHGTNILSTTTSKRGTMEKIANFPEVFYDIADVEKDLDRAINKAYHSSDDLWHIIKAQTAAGKTNTFFKLMENNPDSRILIAAPTNILKNQIYEDADKRGLNVIKTPSLEELRGEIPSDIQRRIDYLYKTGRHRAVHSYINDTLKKEDIPCLREYLDEREKMKTFNGNVITTHRYLMTMDEKRLREYDAVIIDEDILLKSIISNQGTITVSELKKLLKSTTDRRLSDKVKELLKNIKTKKLIKLHGFEWDDDDKKEDDDGKSTPIDLPSFCLTKHFYFRKASEEKNLKEDTISFIKPVEFKKIKYIMVSATVDEKICRNYFGENNVNFYECKRAKYTGVLNQYPQKSMSRSCIDNNSGIIQKIIKRFNIERVITHKKYGYNPLHYGNTDGSNLYEGKDILVIGTPYHAEFLYKLFAFTIGQDFDENAKMKSDCATRNGYKFSFTTYCDEGLRDIHFWMLESELEQAVGRARLLRRDCTVHLFSNFPLRQAVMGEFDFEGEA